ncbi:hypothetical protein BGX26_005834 [Mortierella sp. AD094]|nr:hypothetical protein BGX26_005834 [Mortierella sp. AD094]
MTLCINPSLNDVIAPRIYYEDGSTVAVFGGFVNRSSTSDHSVYFLDTRTWSWTISTSNSVRGRSYSACALSGNQFIVWGGFYQNPTSSPNNLPSVEESTLVYSLDAQNWVNNFAPSRSSFGSEPASGSGSGSGSRVYSGSGDHSGSGDLSNSKGSKLIGVILAIAAVGTFVALLIIGGAIMVIRKRNRLRHANSRSGSSGLSHLASVNSVANLSSKKGNWDLSGVASGREDLSHFSGADDIPPVSGYNPWEHRGSIASHMGDDVETTTTITNPMMGVTQTTIVATSKNSSKMNKVTSIMPTNKKAADSSYGHRPSEQDFDGVTRTMTSFTRSEVQDFQPQESWVEGRPFHQFKNLEQKFEEKSQGIYYPISVEREYR